MKIFNDSTALSILASLVDRSVNYSQYDRAKCDRYHIIAYKFKQYIQDPSDYNKNRLFEVCGDYKTVDGKLQSITYRMDLPMGLDEWYKAEKIMEKV